jgi:hypothetical protein
VPTPNVGHSADHLNILFGHRGAGFRTWYFGGLAS